MVLPSEITAPYFKKETFSFNPVFEVKVGNEK